MKNRTLHLIFIQAVLILSTVKAQLPVPESIFSETLTQQEKTELSQGKILIKNTKNTKRLSLLQIPQTEYVYTNILKLNPSYLAEIIQIIPFSEKPDLIEKIKEIFTDIEDYKGIPYYSEHNDIWVDLYSNAQIKSINEEKTVINADFHMIPFGDFSSEIKIKYDENSLMYENINSTPIKYRNINCIKINNMHSYIIILKRDGYWILYGIGAINAPVVPGLSSRIELSFMNRIKTFCSFVFSKL